MNKLLNHIQSPQDLRQIPVNQLPELAQELRDFILDIIAVKPGHLGASLGVIELTIALHYYYNTPHDLLIWDVGHQSYPHKILTGRKDIFETLRQSNGISGFPVITESEYDTFGTGHSSTSISAITGMALADKIKRTNRKHIAVIGDASIVSGMAIEGLNHLGATDLDVLIILNDNNIGIDPAVGALQAYFNQKNTKSCAFFESLGFYYHSPINGHDIDAIIESFEELEEIKGPKLLHIKTIKGKGFEKAEQNQILWHAPGKFDRTTGELLKPQKNNSFAQKIGDILTQTFQNHPETVAITPAMPTGSGLVKLMQNFPDRVWDVGIAEQHAVTLGAGIATQGLKPFVVIYSTFLQRAYDQVIHDIALQNLPVVLLIDRAGITGNDGATHHGYFDIAYMNAIPNFIVTAPANGKELEEIIQLATKADKPWAIRYPKGEITLPDDAFTNTEFGKAKKIKSGKKIAILSTGHMAEKVGNAVIAKNVAWYHFPFIKPLDLDCLKEIFSQYDVILTFEEGIISGGFGMKVLHFANENNYSGTFKIFGFPDKFIYHGTTDELLKETGLDTDAISEEITKYL